MNDQLKKMLQAQRKNARQIAELNQLKTKVQQHVKTPETEKTLKMIDEALAELAK